MSLFGTASLWSKIGLILILLALILSVVGFATNFWMTEETIRVKVDTSVGFFKAVDCSTTQTSCITYEVPDYIKTGSFTLTMVMAGINLGLIFIVFCMYAAYVATESVRQRGVQLTILILGIIGGIVGFIMIVVWLTQLPNFFYASWSFGVSVFAVMLFVIASLLLLHDMKQMNKKKGDTKRPPSRSNRVRTPKVLTDRATIDRTPSVPPFSPHWGSDSRYNTPRPTYDTPKPSYKKISPEPKPSPRSVQPPPRTLTVTPSQIRMESISEMSSYSSRTSRRYGTPLASTRYDNRAR